MDAGDGKRVGPRASTYYAENKGVLALPTPLYVDTAQSEADRMAAAMIPPAGRDRGAESSGVAHMVERKRARICAPSPNSPQRALESPIVQIPQDEPIQHPPSVSLISIALVFGTMAESPPSFS